MGWVGLVGRVGSLERALAILVGCMGWVGRVGWVAREGRVNRWLVEWVGKAT